MSVTMNTPIATYTADGLKTSFALTFEVEDKNNIRVSVNNITVSKNDYNYSSINNSINFYQPVQEGSEVKLERATDLERSNDYESFGNGFRPESLNYDFNRIWRALQERGVQNSEALTALLDTLSTLTERDRTILDATQEQALKDIHQDTGVADLIKSEAEARKKSDEAYNLLAQIEAGKTIPELKEYIDSILGIKNPLLLSGITSRLIVDHETGETVKQALDSQANFNSKAITTVEFIADLVTIKNPKNGQIVKVKSFHEELINKGGGNFVFVKEDMSAFNEVSVFKGIGGNWHRLNWKLPSIYDAGLTGNEVDTAGVNTKLQALIDAVTAEGLSINLKNKVLRFTELDLPSNVHLYDGVLDATKSTWHLTYGRGAIMFKTTPRNAVGVDYEAQAQYAAINETKNIKFVNVRFKADQKIAYFFKFDGLELINCSGEWETMHLFKFIGGVNGTKLVGDTPTEYNIIDPINGWCKNILIKGGQWKGGYKNYNFASPFHFVACKDVLIEQTLVDAPLGYHIDTYNRNFRINQANYQNTNKQIITDIINGLAEPDMLAMYIGQNSYEIAVNGGTWYDFGKKGLYVEVGSNITVDGVKAEVSVPNSETTFIDIQANYRDNTNTYWGNCSNILIRNVSSKGTKYGIDTSPYNSVKSIKELHISDSDVQTYTNQQGVVLRGVDTYSLTNVKSKGSLYIGGNNVKGVIKSCSFHNTLNYALYIDDLKTGDFPKIRYTDFIVGSGNVIYNNGGISKSCKIIGGNIYAEDFVGSIISNGPNATELVVDNFEYQGDRHLLYNRTITIKAAEKISLYLNDGRFKPGWSCTANIMNADTIGQLGIQANVLNGSIYVTIENKTGTDITDLALNLILHINTFSSNNYPN